MKIMLFLAGLCLGGVIGVWGARVLAQDACLDAGGAFLDGYCLKEGDHG